MLHSQKFRILVPQSFCQRYLPQCPFPNGAYFSYDGNLQDLCKSNRSCLQLPTLHIYGFLGRGHNLCNILSVQMEIDHAKDLEHEQVMLQLDVVD